jgi:hypothetical protein
VQGQRHQDNELKGLIAEKEEGEEEEVWRFDQYMQRYFNRDRGINQTQEDWDQEMLDLIQEEEGTFTLD